MSQAGNMDEPDMEALLASIRRAIEDEDIAAGVGVRVAMTPAPMRQPLAARALRAPIPVPSVASDIGELRRKINAELSRVPGREAQPARLPLAPRLQAAQKPAARAPLAPPVRPAAAAANPPELRVRPRLSETFNFTSRALRPALLAEPAAVAAAPAAPPASPEMSGFEAMTREMLQPMLKQWLDANLPALVEKLVREEMERVARRGR